MAHMQQQILDAVVAALVAAGTDAVDRVFLDRVDPLQPDELPAILVEESPNGEVVTPTTVSGLQQRDMLVLVTPVVSGVTSYGTQARELGLQVEKALAAHSWETTVAQGGGLIQSTRPLFDGDGKDAKAGRQQTWTFTYFVRPDAPDQLP